jgi:hypothetical protein
MSPRELVRSLAAQCAEHFPEAREQFVSAFRSMAPGEEDVSTLFEQLLKVPRAAVAATQRTMV